MNEENLKNAIVRIELEIYNSEKAELITSNGTGFFIEKNIILTCYHVIENYKKEEDIKIFLNNEASPYQATLLDKNEDNDLAVLQIESNNQYFVEINNKVTNGNLCYIHGFPEIDGDNKILKEIIDRPLSLEIEGTDKNKKIIQFKNGQVKSGFSGSPILNLSTHAVCGVICISRNTSNFLGGYGIPIEKLKLLNYKKNNTIEKHIPLKNGKSFTLEFVKVELEKDKILYVGKYPVTFEEYDLFCEEKNLKKISTYIKKENRDKSPVVKVTWKDAMEYCKWLNKDYRLPISQEWELFAKDITLSKIQEICFDKCIKGIWNNTKLEENIHNRENITLLPLKEVGFRVVYESL